MGRRQYNKEYKLVAAKFIQEDKIKIAEATTHFRLSNSTLYRWLEEYEKYGDR